MELREAFPPWQWWYAARSPFKN